MFKATTLFEALTAIAVFTIAFYIFSPVYFRLSDKIKIESEAEGIRTFIYQIQNKSRLNKERYTLSVASQNKKWCMVAIPFAKNRENQTACNCFQLTSCHLEKGYVYYENTFRDVEFYSQSIYPKIFMRINGVSGNSESKCATLVLNNERRILGFDPYGVIYVPSPNKRSECKKSI